MLAGISFHERPPSRSLGLDGVVTQLAQRGTIVGGENSSLAVLLRAHTPRRPHLTA